jgi:phosphonate transport system ATP-binding protein
MMHMVAISVSGLSKRYGKTRALDNVSIEVQRGEMVALIGASGSGESTLIRHIAGLEAGDGETGKVMVLGEVSQRAGRLMRGRPGGRVAVIFQQFNLVGRLSVLTNVLIGNLGRVPRWRGTLGLFSRSEKEKAATALARVGIPSVAAQRSSTLSGGQQQRAAIARTLVQEAEILIADEPISALDPSSARRVMDVLANINTQDNITVLVSLHQVEYARRYCKRTIAMRDGRVVYDGPSTSLSNSFLAELYGDASEELVLPESSAELLRARPVRPNGHEPVHMLA